MLKTTKKKKKEKKSIHVYAVQYARDLYQYIITRQFPQTHACTNYENTVEYYKIISKQNFFLPRKNCDTLVNLML